jgi:hypothetical protein
MQSTPNTVDLVFRFAFEESYNPVILSHHIGRAIRPQSDEFGSPSWTEDIEDGGDKLVHIERGMSFVHGNGDDVNVEYVTVAMNTNAIIEV